MSRCASGDIGSGSFFNLMECSVGISSQLLPESRNSASRAVIENAAIWVLLGMRGPLFFGEKKEIL